MEAEHHHTHCVFAEPDQGLRAADHQPEDVVPEGERQEQAVRDRGRDPRAGRQAAPQEVLRLPRAHLHPAVGIRVHRRGEEVLFSFSKNVRSL